MVKTLKIQDITHAKLEELQRQLSAKTLGEAIDKIMAGYDYRGLDLTITSHEILPDSNLTIDIDFSLPVKSVIKLGDKIKYIALMHRCCANISTYINMIEHIKILEVTKKVNEGLITADELTRRISEEMKKLEQLSTSLSILERLPIKSFKKE